MTLADLPAGSLAVVATDLNHGRGVSIPNDLPRYGVDGESFPVARAVRMSAVVPFLFTPVRLQDRIRGETVLMSDGAMSSNFPIGLAGPESPILGFRLVGDGTRDAHEPVAGPLVDQVQSVVSIKITYGNRDRPITGVVIYSWFE